MGEELAIEILGCFSWARLGALGGEEDLGRINKYQYVMDGRVPQSHAKRCGWAVSVVSLHLFSPPADLFRVADLPLSPPQRHQRGQTKPLQSQQVLGKIGQIQGRES